MHQPNTSHFIFISCQPDRAIEWPLRNTAEATAWRWYPTRWSTIVLNTGYILKQGLANHGAKAKSGLLLFYKQNSLEHNHTHHLHVFGFFHATLAELSSCVRDCMIHKTWNIYSLAFTKFATLALNQRSLYGLALWSHWEPRSGKEDGPVPATHLGNVCL